MTEARPKFRTDIIVAQHEEADGTRSVVLKDPICEKFFRLSVFEYQFLRMFDGTRTLDEALERFKLDGQYCSPEEARLILGKAAELGLLLGTRFGTAQFQLHLRERYAHAKRSQLFSSVYFLFIPVLNPDAFLDRTLWVFRLFANKWTALVTALLVPGALYLLVAALSDLQREYSFFFNWQNLLYLWFTIAIIKLVHEFAHAYTAKSFGLHVPQMGVAFLIFFPCLYCNTTDAWQLADRKQRMAISAAGIIAEGAFAVLASYVWYFSTPGIINSLAFYLMILSLSSTILFNGNPLMKFDGYFLLIDYIGVPNLQAKSMGYLKYLFMNCVLGMTLVPNTAFDRKESILFCTYGVSAFIYRIFLYTGIVAGVYFRFDKMLGILLAILAFSLFCVKPVIKGVRTIYARRAEISLRPEGLTAFAVLVVVFLGMALIPWSSTSVYPCYVASSKVQKLTIPLQTSVGSVFVQRDSLVSKGALLFELDTSLLKLALLTKEMKRDIAQKQVEMLLLDAKDRGKAPSKQLEVYQAEDEVLRIKEQLDIALISNTAPFEGAVTNLDYRLQPGYQPGEGTVVGELQSLDPCIIRALIPEADRDKVYVGLEVEIWLPVRRGLVLHRKIDSIKPYSEKDLRDSPFSSRVGGELATEVRGDQLKDVPLDAQYACSVSIENKDHAIPLGMTGRFVVPSPRQSLVSRYVKKALRVFNRESIL